MAIIDSPTAMTAFAHSGIDSGAADRLIAPTMA